MIGLVHWAFLILLLIAIFLMIIKKDSFFFYLFAIFIIGLVATKSILKSMIGLTDILIYVLKDFSGIILLLGTVISLGKLLDKTGILDFYLKPFTKVIKNKYIGFWVFGIISLLLSFFLYPSPAVILVAVIFLPIARKINMPILWVAVALNLFSHGFSLSGDYIIQTVPSFVAKSAQISVDGLVSSSIPLWLIMGISTTIASFVFLCLSSKKDQATSELIKQGKKKSVKEKYFINETKKRILAWITLIVIVTNIILILFCHFDSNESRGILCGSVFFLIFIIGTFGVKKVDVIEDNILGGMKYAISLFAKVLPMAAFFYLGDKAFIEIYGENILGINSQGIINDLGMAITNLITINKTSAVTITGILGAITGLDGSGLSGISLVGSTAKLLTTSFPKALPLVASYGQLLAIYVGGGCVVPVAALPVAIACDIDVREIIQVNIKSILIGAIITGVAAILLI